MEINEIIYQIVCSAWTLCGDLLCGQIVSSSVLHFLQYLGFFGDFQWFFGTFQDNLELFTRIHSSVLTFFFNAAPAESLGNSYVRPFDVTFHSNYVKYFSGDSVTFDVNEFSFLTIWKSHGVADLFLLHKTLYGCDHGGTLAHYPTKCSPTHIISPRFYHSFITLYHAAIYIIYQKLWLNPLPFKAKLIGVIFFW